MNPILSAGLLIGLLCSVWIFVMGVTGWYKDPAVANVFVIVIAIESGGLSWGLRKTARQGRAYGGQIVAGAMMAIVAGVIIIASSLVFTTVVFPNSIAEVEQMYRTKLEPQGRSESEITAAIQGTAASRTPMAQAENGLVGTFLTGIVASAVIAIFVRRRGPRR
jgi:TM2 domain-containing membrane protein YozV